MVPPLRRLISMASAFHCTPPHGDEVDGEPAEDALAREDLADPLRLRGDEPGVRGVGGEAAPEVGLAGRPAEHLVVRREHLDLAQRGHPQLHARAAQLVADDPLLDDAAALVELGEEGAERRSWCPPGSCPSTREATAARSCGAAGAGQVREVDHRVSGAGHALVELDHRRGRRGAAAAVRASACTTSSPECRSSTPGGYGHRPRANSRRQPVFVPSGKSRGSAPYMGMPSSRARSRSSVVVLYGTRWDSERLRDEGADRAITRGRASSFSVSGRCRSRRPRRGRAGPGRGSG